MKIQTGNVLLAITLVLLFSMEATSQSKRIVGLIPFDNNGGSSHKWVARGIEEILTKKLSELNVISLYEKETLRRVLISQDVSSSEVVNAKKAFSIGKETGVEVLYLGSYSVEGDQISGKFKAISTYTGSPIMDAVFAGPLGRISDIFEEKIRQSLAIMQVPVRSTEDAAFSRDLTASINAFESYCKAYIEIDKESPIEVVAGYFQRALQSDPQFWQARYNLGVIYYNARFYDRALIEFNSVISQYGDVAEPYFGKGVIFFLQKKYDQALTQLKSAIRLDSKSDRAYYYQGITYTRLDSIKKGIQALERSITLNPNYAPSHYQLGLADMKRGWFKKAVTSLTMATKLNPDFYVANNALGEAYYALNLFEEAIIEFNKAIKLKSNYATAYFNLGNSIYKKGALEEIVDAFWALIEVQYEPDGTNGNTSDPTPLAGLERLREKSRIEDSSVILRKMINAYRTALEYDQRFYEASYNLALTYENLNNPDSASFFFKMAINQRPDLAQAHMRLGKIYESKSQFDLALHEFKDVVKYEPDYFAANPKLGESYRYVNIIEIVLREQQTILKRDAANKDALQVIGKIYLSLGRLGQAEQYFEQLVQLSPNDMLAQQTLREIRRKLRKL